MIDMELVESIVRIESEIRNAKDGRKTIQEALQSEIEGLPTFDALTKTREAHKAELAGDRAVQELKDSLGEQNQKIKDLDEIMTHHLTQYFAKTGDSAVPVPDGRDKPVNEKPIVFKAKLGKERPHQEAMPFGKNHVSITKPDGEVIAEFNAPEATE